MLEATFVGFFCFEQGGGVRIAKDSMISSGDRQTSKKDHNSSSFTASSLNGEFG